MESIRVVDKRSIRLEKILAADYIPFLGGRPPREIVIGSEDLLNLRIALGTSHDVSDIVEGL